MWTRFKPSYYIFFAAALLVLHSTSVLSADPIGVIPVHIEINQGNYSLIRGGQPYFIKGAGIKTKYMDRLAKAGGNSVRTWSVADADLILDQAYRLGLTVTLGLWVRTERSGFNYDDPNAVAQQLDKITQAVLKYKDHPALLMWGIGNEVNMNYSNVGVWDAIEEIAVMIDELDGQHPKMTVLAGMPKRDIKLVREQCPHIDILGINAYAALPRVPKKIREYGWEGPYVVTEWGSNGYWEVPTTGWGAALEPSSSEKATVYRGRYENVILGDVARSFGSYVFYWGYSQEWTPTWFGLFTDGGFETPVVDAMQFLWSGAWPNNRAPTVGGLSLDGLLSGDQDIYLDSSNTYQANASVTDPDGDKVQLKWFIHREHAGATAGGDLEMLSEIAGQPIQNGEGLISVKAPSESGAYRLYLYAYDSYNHVASVNLPFYVN